MTSYKRRQTELAKELEGAADDDDDDMAAAGDAVFIQKEQDLNQLRLQIAEVEAQQQQVEADLESVNAELGLLQSHFDRLKVLDGIRCSRAKNLCRQSMRRKTGRGSNATRPLTA